MSTDKMPSPRLVQLRSQDFLARTGDRSSIVRLLEAIGDPEANISNASLDKVFANPQAYQELMDPESRVRLQVIERYSKNNPERAVRFSIDSLAQSDPDLTLLALDMLDSNQTSLEPGLERHLNKLLSHPQERVRVKASRLLVDLSNAFSLELSDSPALQILEAALDSPDRYCRQMAYSLPPSVFYKHKHLKSTLHQLRQRLNQTESELEAKQEVLQALQNQLRSQQQHENNAAHLLENLETANQLLQGQLDKYAQALRERDQQMLQERQSKSQLLEQLLKERKARATEVHHARELYESLVTDFQQREGQFKHQVYDFYNRFREMFTVLLEEKESLLEELYRQSPESP